MVPVMGSCGSAPPQVLWDLSGAPLVPLPPPCLQTPEAALIGLCPPHYAPPHCIPPQLWPPILLSVPHIHSPPRATGSPCGSVCPHCVPLPLSPPLCSLPLCPPMSPPRIPLCPPHFVPLFPHCVPPHHGASSHPHPTVPESHKKPLFLPKTPLGTPPPRVSLPPAPPPAPGPISAPVSPFSHHW